MDAILGWIFLLSAIAIWYFIKKKPHKQYRNISIGVLFISIALIMILPDDETEETATAVSTTKLSSDYVDSSAEQEKLASSMSEEKEIKESEETEKSIKKETKESKERKEKEKEKKNKEETDEINNRIAERLSEDQGFAVGEGTEDGQPNPAFEWSLTVDQIRYENDTVIVAVNDNFFEYNKPQGAEALLKAQNMAATSAGETKNWDTKDYQRGIFTTAVYGNQKVAESKMLDVKDFKWED